MTRQRLRVASIAVLLALAAAIPASTQGFSEVADQDIQSSRLPMLILVNRMELTTEQMRGIHDLLQGLLADREALRQRRAEFEKEMIAFAGTSEELDEILEAFRAQTKEQLEAARGRAEDVVDQIKGILTLKQGEILQEYLPGLFDGADRDAVASRSAFRRSLGSEDEGAASGLRGRLLERMEERLADRPELLERLRQRFEVSDEAGWNQGPGRCGATGTMLGERATWLRQRLSEETMEIPLGAGCPVHRGVDVIEQLLDVLELKLEATE